MKRRTILCLTPLLVTYSINAGGQHMADTAAMTKLEVQRLPDLNVPRGGHSIFYANGELTVVGGHTSGFIPTATAEYLADGKWNLMETVYAHDGGFTVKTRSGRVMIGGGSEKPLGIGQVHHAEWYDPTTHTFEGFGCLDIRRAYAQAAELRNGDIAISGNWYHHDSTEVFRQPQQFYTAREVSLQRSSPLIFPTSDGDALVMGTIGTHGEDYGFTTVVDRLYGTPFDMPLLAEWRLPRIQLDQRTADFCISDTALGEYAYMMPVSNRKGETSIAVLRDTVLSLLHTTTPVPTEGHWGHIDFSFITLDRKAERAYLIGRDTTLRIYVCAVDYSTLLTPQGRLRPTEQTGASLPTRLYYTDPQTDIGWGIPVTTDEGDIALAGGVYDNNFTPMSGVCLLPLGQHPKELSIATGRWVGIGVGLLMVVLGAMLSRLRRRNKPEEVLDEAPEEADEAPASSEVLNQLMQRLDQLMEEKKLYLQSDLKVSDVAKMLHTTRRNVSECITARHEYTSFAHFVNGYRVKHAQQLLRQHPDMKTSSVGLESGFANEPSFFRTFKTITGMTPREWVNEGK